MKTTEDTKAKAIERMEELQDISISRYLEKMDYSIDMGLSDDEEKEYNTLYKEVNGECNQCGELSEECNCKP